jgi:PHD/YefM family antitoxin component YafN of YafNO toxin-antitoxin module
VRRNETVRVREERRREDKLAQLQAKVAERNAFVKDSKRASAAAGLAALQRWTKSHKLSAFVTLTLKERVIVYIDEEAKEQDALLDGCYLLETNVRAKTVDARYQKRAARAFTRKGAYGISILAGRGDRGNRVVLRLHQRLS